MSTGLSKKHQAKLDAQLDKWQQDLVNLTKRNKLLYFRHTTTSSLEIVEPSMSEIASRIENSGWSFVMPPSESQLDEASQPRARRSDELQTSKQSGKDVLASLRSLERTSNQTMLDSGLWVLYAAFGMLKWIDPSDDKVCESPLLLRPVALSRAGVPTDFRLVATDDDSLINPALTIMLANDFGITVPSIDETDGSPETVVAAVRRAVAKQKTWTVEDRVVLTTFTFHKEAMYRDLITNREEVASSPFVRLAAIGPEAGAEEFAFTPTSDDDLDRDAPPEHLVSIRDADSTQRKCIVAARDGRSFVMDGPPGSGKSQTITNIITELLHAGKSVLFVSEKAAALEVVSRRLGEAGLSEFVLELHSHKATRKEVAVELGRSLGVSLRARSTFSTTDRATLIRLRQELSDYAMAVNEVRQPLGQSLHQVLGRILQLDSPVEVPIARAIDVSLSPEDLGEALDNAERLGRAWGPIVRGDSFLWQSLLDDSYSAARRLEIQRLLDDCSSAVEQLVMQLFEVDAATGMTWSSNLETAHRAQVLAATIESHPRRAELPSTWLSGEDLESLTERLAERRAQVERVLTQRATALKLGGNLWRSAPRERAELVRTSLARLTDGASCPWVDDATTAETLAGVIRFWDDAASRADSMAHDAAIVAQKFGIARGALTLDRCDELVELVSMIGSSTPPEPEWLSLVAQPALIEAASVLTELVDAYRRRRESLRDTFKDDALDLNLVELRSQLVENSGIRKLGGTYRSAKKTLAACVVGGKVTPAVIAKLDKAIAWRALHGRLRAAENAHSRILGRYYVGSLHTDIGRLNRAVHLARRAVAICGAAPVPDVLLQVVVDSQSGSETVKAGERLGAAVARWRLDIHPMLGSAGSDPGFDIDELASSTRVTRQYADQLVPVLVEVNEAVGLQLTAVEMCALLDAADAARAGEEAVASTSDHDRREFGPSWNEVETDFGDVERDIAWAKAVITAADGPLDDHSASAVVDLEPMAAELADHLGSVAKTWGAIADLFSQPWRDRLSADFRVSFEAGLALIEEMRDSITDIEEWSRYTRAHRSLADSGFEDILAFLKRENVAAVDVASAIERSILESWTDKIMAADPRLNILSPGERADIVEQFRRLDRSLVANAAASVINACAARRPSTALGAAGVIRREAQKKTRHKPIRTLLEETKEVSLALKPCFMMSPLSVSQYLPADAIFDVVIFDEASQVKPADAVNCIYRGRQLIIAGDPRQLPPTNFFERAPEEGNDDFDEAAPEVFESVLDVFLGSGLPPLSLQWHYRSQHESLITYSNYRFYDGALHTFPGAVDEADDVGVVLIPANGVYRRGGARDNPIEAAKVVDQVLFHRRHHPGLTLGVVAFSSAQESAIVAELERRHSQDPEIADLLTSGDRLDGFFVKNLENVQGDERDIIIFSIGYGPDENGRFTEQLGPLGQEGGERRLNVAITRARRRVEVVASITAGSFPGTSAKPGIRHLQNYLDFAERGVQALAFDVEHGGRDAESVFEEVVLNFIASLGLVATPQVGVAGYRIDIGIRHPGRPGEFILGVECDGAAYHSTRVARDRDRLRQEILEGLGWRMHRIWGPSWFRDRRGQEEALRAAISEAMGGHSTFQRARPMAVRRPKIEMESVDLDARPEWADEYALSAWRPRRSSNSVQVHEVPTHDLVVAMRQVVSDEGPIHEDLLMKRIADAYGARRIGERIKEAFDKAIRAAIREKSIERVERVFLQIHDVAPRVRTPDESDERTRRSVAQIPAAERQLAIELLVAQSRRVEKDDLRTAYGRLFGWKRIGIDIESAFERDFAAVVKAKRVRLEGRDTVCAL